MMRFAVVLSLFFALALGEKKINLEDIERDNLRAESKSRSGNAGPETSSYVAPSKPEKFKQNYSNYVPQLEKYNDYQKVEQEVPKGLSQASTYPSAQQQLYYQPEITVGNRYQAIQQKIVGEKFAKKSNKEHLYVNIPMAQFLSYYPNLGLDQSSSAKQEITIPIYTPEYSREPIYSNSKISYQIEPQYAPASSRYPLVTEAILPTRNHGKFVYSSTNHGHPAQEIIYTQPSAVTYVPVSSSGHENENTHVSQTRQQQSYVPYHQSIGSYHLSTGGGYVPQITNHIYQGQEVESHQENYENVETPDIGLDLPRLPAQNFNSGQSHQESYTSYTPSHLANSNEPRTLLDSYIPSNLIAAQDSERYRERPIRLERGFVPSKINYVQSYKKRKAQ